jgi:VWFA-related protein
VCTLPLLTAATGPQTDSDETFEGAAAVVLVEVPVRVLLEGKPLTGLTAADFEVYDRGELQEITHFEVLDFRRPEEDTVAGAPEERQATAETRNFLFVLDLAYPARSGLAFTGSIVSGTRDLHRNLRSLAAFLRSGIAPNDRWALGYHSPLRGVKLLQPWSSDPAAIEPTLEILEAIALAKPKRVEKGLDAWESSRADTGGIPASLIPTGDDLVAEARTASVRADPFLPQLQTIENLAEGMVALTEALGEATGPRHLVYVARGFPLSEDGTSAPILNRLQQLFRDFRSSGWTIESINPIGSAVGEGGSLLLIAHETGGQVHTNSKELSELLERVVVETAYSYVLGFNPVEIDDDGRYHRLKVKLVDGPRSADVVHRRGYYASSHPFNPGVEDPAASSAGAPRPSGG